jgi:serine/threonine-protein kinase
VLQIVEALDYAHSKGVIHRDLKPSNTMVAKDGTVKVMDFGIARAQRFEGMTITGSFLGSPDYAAPETIEGRKVDARSDLYSVGVVLFELLTGRRPFEGDTSFMVLQKHTSEPPLPPSRLRPGLPPELDAITLKLLAKAPEGRYASAEELLLALRGFLDAAR